MNEFRGTCFTCRAFDPIHRHGCDGWAVTGSHGQCANYNPCGITIKEVWKIIEECPEFIAKVKANNSPHVLELKTGIKQAEDDLLLFMIKEDQNKR